MVINQRRTCDLYHGGVTLRCAPRERGEGGLAHACRGPLRAGRAAPFLEQQVLPLPLAVLEAARPGDDDARLRGAVPRGVARRPAPP